MSDALAGRAGTILSCAAPGALEVRAQLFWVNEVVPRGENSGMDRDMSGSREGRSQAC